MPALGCDPHFLCVARRTGTGPTSTDGACCVHARAFVLGGSAYDASDNVMLAFVVVISIAVRVELVCSTASATACPR